ncbi:MAG TPA: hypothetical protein VLF62_02675 [Candidatus Saccharimonadales bacterium]|nr:hypothetical protein [Candidatus Saccharimonadales bacterium]
MSDIAACGNVLPRITEPYQLLPGLISRTCGAYDASRGEMPDAERSQHLKQLRDTCATLDVPGQDTFAASLIAANRTQESTGTMDSIMREALLEGDELSEALFINLGLETKTSFRALKLWEAGYGQDTLPNNEPDPSAMTHAEYLQECAQRTLDIERQRPGGVRLLAKRYGIRNTGRIPEDWLLDTIDNGHNPHKRVIFAAFASRCRNGALEQTAERLNETRKKLPEDTVMVPVEIARRSELEERLGFLERAQNISGHKSNVAGAIMAGHGNHREGRQDQIGLCVIYGARSSYTEFLTLRDIEGTIGNMLIRVLAPDAHTFLLSCSMAADDNGLGARLSDRMHRDVVGLREPAGMASVEIIINGDAVRFVPKLRTRIPASPTEWKGIPSDPRYLTPHVSQQTASAPGLASAA